MCVNELPYRYAGTEGSLQGHSINLAVHQGSFTCTAGSMSQPGVNDCFAHFLIICVCSELRAIPPH